MVGLTEAADLTQFSHADPCPEWAYERTQRDWLPAALQAGATMLTHLFNAMQPLHHRNPGPFGTLGKTSGAARPYFGIIADGIHLHPTTVKIAWTAHPDGFVLVTDAMKTLGLPDGLYDWTNGDRWEKKAPTRWRAAARRGGSVWRISGSGAGRVSQRL